jgi:hypothetical protein
MSIRSLYKAMFILGISLLPFTPIIAEEPATQPTKEDALTRTMRFATNLYQQGKLDGEILVVKEGKTLLHLASNESLGILCHESDGPQYVIGNTSQQFLTAAILKALYDASPAFDDEDKIAEVKQKIKSPVSHFLPRQHAVWNGTMPDWADKVTLQQLLIHTSGLQDYEYSAKYEETQSSVIAGNNVFISRGKIIEYAIQQPPENEPGEEVEETLVNRLLAIEILEEVAQRTYDVYLEEQLLLPLELSSTAVLPQAKWESLKYHPSFARLAPIYAYDIDTKTLVHVPYGEDMVIFKGTGSLVSNATDLVKWSQALHKDKTVLPEALYEVMFSDDLCKNVGWGPFQGIIPAFGPIEKRESKLGLLISQHSEDAHDVCFIYIPEQDISIISLHNVAWQSHRQRAFDYKIASGGFFDNLSFLLSGLQYRYAKRGSIDLLDMYDKTLFTK